MMRPHYLLLVLSVVLLPLCTVAIGGSESLPGGWTLIEDTKDPHVVEIAQYAVSEYDRESGATLKFESVNSGETQVVSAGINYRLVVEVKDGSEKSDFQALVYEKPYKNLTSFKPFLKG
ncbi:Cysteine proteinase inhibitor [Quillaja saponaria]|uniref:Cysteine proteinase inhibitor n=1 Tax=Quillaja saponaria TaxID=32244 RepID=A0AAD7KV65_QUISA|nr:Cysteine proteinase inhibitor [Quillaja saponaria]